MAAHFAAFWNPKAKQWVSGRRDLFKDLAEKIKPSDQIIWMHCASAGEFEQGKPVIEGLKQIYVHHKILVSFFSPSGYVAGKNSNKADLICYLPLDTKKNAEHFLKIVKPQLVIFIKYEYWYNHLKAIRDHNIPLLLISALFRRDQVFFKRYGSLYRKVLELYTNIFVQDEVSKDLLIAINISSIVNGDTRFDRVAAIANSFRNDNFAMECVKMFAGNYKVLVAGSTWPKDEKIIAQALDEMSNIKLIVAPHEINKEHINSIETLFPYSIRYSECKEIISAKHISAANTYDIKNPENASVYLKRLQEANVLILDNVGMLSRIYQYAAISYIGGGFNKSGIHNTLEAAVSGQLVLFGPNYRKFKEAGELIKAGAAFSISSAKELNQIIEIYLFDEGKLNQSSAAAKKYVLDNQGATEGIIDFIQENRLLTN
jgi:3-deoxy-D-manno-octulosonic-acid transferase